MRTAPNPSSTPIGTGDARRREKLVGKSPQHIGQTSSGDAGDVATPLFADGPILGSSRASCTAVSVVRSRADELEREALRSDPEAASLASSSSEQMAAPATAAGLDDLIVIFLEELTRFARFLKLLSPAKNFFLPLFALATPESAPWGGVTAADEEAGAGGAPTSWIG